VCAARQRLQGSQRFASTRTFVPEALHQDLLATVWPLYSLVVIVRALPHHSGLVILSTSPLRFVSLPANRSAPLIHPPRPELILLTAYDCRHLSTCFTRIRNLGASNLRARSLGSHLEGKTGFGRIEVDWVEEHLAPEETQRCSTCLKTSTQLDGTKPDIRLLTHGR
jgi:hypothetical protein